MPFASRPLLVRILGVAALGLFGLNFATWAHGRFADRPIACHNSRAIAFQHAAEDHSADAHLAPSVDVQVYRWDAEREVERRVERAARTLEATVVQQALQAAGDHLDDERVVHLLEHRAHVEAKAEIERALRAAGRAGVVTVR